MRSPDHDRRFSLPEYGLILLCFLTCLAGALLLPVDQCPDEAGRLLLSDWIVKTGSLPTGNEPEVWIEGWGYSYALYPYLSAIVGALFHAAASLVTGSPRVLLAASRMCSVLSITGGCAFCLLLGRRLFRRRESALLLSALVCFLPQVLFLGMYQNNDSLALFAASMLMYFLVRGHEDGWSVPSCVGVGAAMSVGLLSYYTVYGWLLMGAVFCLVSILTDRRVSRKGGLILRRAALIGGICLLLAGWSFLRNAMLHGGDFLGFASEARSREDARAMGIELYGYGSHLAMGVSMPGFLRTLGRAWLRTTAQSFIGVFGYMVWYLPKGQYALYAAAVGSGLLLCLAVLCSRRPEKRDLLVMMTMACSVAINFGLHLWHSYARDYQPQGRYVISAALLLGYLIAYGLDESTLSAPGPDGQEGKRLRPAAALTVVWLLLAAWALFGTMTKALP